MNAAAPASHRRMSRHRCARVGSGSLERRRPGAGSLPSPPGVGSATVRACTRHHPTTVDDVAGNAPTARRWFARRRASVVFCGYRFDGARRSSGGSALADLLRRPRVEVPLPEVLAEWGFVLGDKETVAYFGYGKLDAAYGFLAITDRRVAFFAGRRGHRLLDWALEDVREVEPRRGWAGRRLRLARPGGQRDTRPLRTAERAGHDRALSRHADRNVGPGAVEGARRRRFPDRFRGRSRADSRPIPLRASALPRAPGDRQHVRCTEAARGDVRPRARVRGESPGRSRWW